jgi:hypothetical protein
MMPTKSEDVEESYSENFYDRVLSECEKRDFGSMNTSTSVGRFNDRGVRSQHSTRARISLPVKC